MAIVVTITSDAHKEWEWKCVHTWYTFTHLHIYVKGTQEFIKPFLQLLYVCRLFRIKCKG
jgi:hypothetical protein